MRFLLTLMILSFLLFSSQPAQAAVFLVGTGSPASCTDAALSSAIGAAESSMGGMINFNCGGMATISILSQKVISTSIILDGGGLITLNGGNFRRIFRVLDSGKLTLKNIILSNGYTIDDGGAIFSTGELVLEHVTIRNSMANELGGALASSGPLTISASIIENNAAVSGGGLYLAGFPANVMITNSEIRGNTTLVSGGWGGGILADLSTQLTLNNTLVTGNTASSGGGIFILKPETSVTLNQGSRITNNTANDSDPTTAEQGGGIFSNGILTVFDGTLSGNLSTGKGGALANFGTANLQRTTIHNNNAIVEAGGIQNAGNLTLTNATISNNGKYGIHIAGPAYATNVTLSGNTLANIYTVSSSISLKNSALAHALGGVNCIGTMLSIVSAGSNLSSDASCAFANTGDWNNTDPLLGSLADNGGLTQTMLPLTGSPLRETGASAGAPPTDQRGLPRPSGAAVDIGAVEVQVTLVRVYIPITMK